MRKIQVEKLALCGLLDNWVFLTLLRLIRFCVFLQRKRGKSCKSKNFPRAGSQGLTPSAYRITEFLDFFRFQAETYHVTVPFWSYVIRGSFSEYSAAPGFRLFTSTLWDVPRLHKQAVSMQIHSIIMAKLFMLAETAFTFYCCIVCKIVFELAQTFAVFIDGFMSHR